MKKNDLLGWATPDTSIIMDAAIKEMRRLEDELLKKVVSQLLGREPVREDGKRLTKVYREGEPLNYQLLFDNDPVGIVTFNVTGPSWGITFSPHIKPKPAFPPGGIEVVPVVTDKSPD
jgi:hypothetical protein